MNTATKHRRSALAAAAIHATMLSTLAPLQTKGEDGQDDPPANPGIIQIKTLIEEQGKAWAEFKKVNDELIKAKADGKAVGDLEAKLGKISGELDKLTEMKQQFDDLMLKLQRPGGLGSGSKGDGDLEAETKSFNAYRKSFGLGDQAPDLTVDQFVAYKGAFFTLMRKGSLDRLSDTERKAMQAGSDNDGGFLLPTPTVGRIVARQRDLSPMRQLADVQTISTDALEGLVDNDEAGAGWVGEVEDRAETSTPQVGKYKIEAFEMYAQPKATQKLLDDAAVDVEGWLANKVALRFARLEGAAFVTGNGVNKPRGFCAYDTVATGDDTRAWGKLQHVVSGADGAFASTNPADKLHDVIGALHPAYQANARWATRRDVVTLIRKWKDSTGQYLWQPSLQAGTPDQIAGYQIAYMQDMPALAAGSLSLALGDFREGYTIVDRIGVRVLRDPFTAKPYVKFYTTKRTGGGVLNFDAIKFMKFSAS